MAQAIFKRSCRPTEWAKFHFFDGFVDRQMGPKTFFEEFVGRQMAQKFFLMDLFADKWAKNFF